MTGTNHHYPSPGNSAAASLRGCFCCLFLLFSFLLLAALAVALLVFLFLKPHKPTFDLQQVTVTYVALNPNPSATTLSLNIHLTFTSENDNKVGIEYGESRFTVMYRGIPLGRGVVPSFYQPAHSVRRVDTTVVVDRVSLMQADAAEMVGDAQTNDRVDLRVVGDVGAKVRVMGINSPGIEVQVDCTIAISPRKQAVTSKQCGFDGLSV